MTSPILDKWLRSGDPAQDDAGVEPQTAPFRDQGIQAIVPRVMRNFAYELSQEILNKGALAGSTRIIGYKQIDDAPVFATDVGSVETLSTNMMLQVELIAGRVYRVAAGGSLVGTISNENFLINLLGWVGESVGSMDSAVPLLTQRVRTATTPGNSFYAEAMRVVQASGIATVTMSMVRSAGTGVANIVGGVSSADGFGHGPTIYPAIFSIEELL